MHFVLYFYRANKKKFERLQSKRDVDDMINLLRGIAKKKEGIDLT